MVPCWRQATWKIYLAASALILLPFCLWIAADHFGHQNRQNDPLPTVASGALLLRQIANAAKSALYQPNCERPESRDDAAYCDQRRATKATKAQATWAKIQAMLSIAGIIGLIGTLILTIHAVKAARDQAQAAKDSADAALAAVRADNRAWMDIELLQPKMSVIWDDANGVTVNAPMIGNNSGNSPALNAHFTARLLFQQELDRAKIDSIVKETCLANEYAFLDSVVFANKADTKTWTVGKNREEIAAFKAKVAKAYSVDEDATPYWALALIVCVSYKIVGDKDWHHTGRLFKLGMLENTDRGVANVEHAREVNIPEGRVGLERQVTGDYTD